jgi:hypothetical protein
MSTAVAPRSERTSSTATPTSAPTQSGDPADRLGQRRLAGRSGSARTGAPAVAFTGDIRRRMRRPLASRCTTGRLPVAARFRGRLAARWLPRAAVFVPAAAALVPQRVVESVRPATAVVARPAAAARLLWCGAGIFRPVTGVADAGLRGRWPTLSRLPPSPHFHTRLLLPPARLSRPSALPTRLTGSGQRHHPKTSRGQLKARLWPTRWNCPALLLDRGRDDAWKMSTRVPGDGYTWRRASSQTLRDSLPGQG